MHELSVMSGDSQKALCKPLAGSHPYLAVTIECFVQDLKGVHPFIRPSVRPSVRPFVRSFIRPYVHTSIRPYVHTSIRSFMQSCHSDSQLVIRLVIHSIIHLSANLLT